MLAFCIGMLAMAIMGFAVSTTSGTKANKPKPAALSDFSMPTAEAGRAIPVVFGTVLVTGSNVTWYGDLATAPVKTKSGK